MSSGRVARTAALAAVLLLPVAGWLVAAHGSSAIGRLLMLAPPVAVNLLVALAFGFSLLGEPLCTRFARAAAKEATPALMRYGRRLTIAWAAWLALLAAAGVGIAALDLPRLAAFWSGIDYALVAALFVGEHAWRRLRGRSTTGLLEQLRGVRQAMRTRSG